MTTLEIVNELISLDKTAPDYPRKRMALMVKYLTRFMETYDKQYNYEGYTDRTFIDDVLYGLGVALNPEKHQFADGFDTWKETLAQFLKEPDSY
jgi:hypothetical protein